MSLSLSLYLFISMTLIDYKPNFPIIIQFLKFNKKEKKIMKLKKKNKLFLNLKEEKLKKKTLFSIKFY
jgi:hypothetical protein